MATNDCSEEKIRLFRTKFTSLITDTFFPINKNEPNYNAVVISNCNGQGSWSFSDATINYTLPRNFPASMFYISGFAEINQCIRQCLKPGKELEQCNITERIKMEQIVKNFINTVMSDSHEKCLQQLRKDKTLNEEKIKCILAIHYFKPLSKDGIYFNDKCHSCKSCPLCKETIRADMKETSFGHSSVWHGQADIVVQKSIVRIDLEDLAKSSLQDESDEFDFSNIEVKTEESKMNSQAMAQTIVNSFVESRMNKSLFNKFIPSFLATEENIRIILFNCKSDKLLLSDEFPIWKKDGTLSLRTLTFVWLTLNSFMNKIDMNAKHFIDRTPESKFKDAVGESYEIYLNEVSRPLKMVQKEKQEGPDTYELEDWSVICNAKKEIMKMLTED